LCIPSFRWKSSKASHTCFINLVIWFWIKMEASRSIHVIFCFRSSFSSGFFISNGLLLCQNHL
jgi:hypothetical protein